jgi:hypothetical protein
VVGDVSAAASPAALFDQEHAGPPRTAAVAALSDRAADPEPPAANLLRFEDRKMTPTRAKPPTRPPAHSSRFTGVKVFWASMFAQRTQLGETVTQWLEAHPEIELVDMVVTQSSDAHFHLVSICVFYKGELVASVEALPEGPARADALRRRRQQANSE